MLHAEALGGIGLDSPLLHRQIRVGAVEGHQMAEDGKSVRIDIYIQPEYAKRVGSSSRFWNASGVDVTAGIGGVDVHTESLEALLAGGIAFATPDSPGAPVKAGSVFQLHPEAKKEWQKWSSRISEPGEAKPEKEGLVSRIFHHHEDKTEEEAAADHDPAQPEPAKSHKHGFFHKVFHGGD